MKALHMTPWHRDSTATTRPYRTDKRTLRVRTNVLPGNPPRLTSKAAN